ncbi:MAG: DUF2163 domain-containing protein [Pseudomonadota bacterium]
MRTIDPALAARLTGPALSLCLCWRLTRADGVIIGVTDHDQRLTVEGVDYVPGAALEAGTLANTANLKPGRGAASGALDNGVLASGALVSDAITVEDLRDGLWHSAKVMVMRVDWQRPDLGGVEVWSGYLSTVSHTPDGRFEAELVSLKADLERPVGRVVQRRCDAVLGDARCGVDPAGRSCDQRFETCRDVFANTINFRGFPHLPGPDFVLAGPAGQNNDGGRR